MIKLFLMAIFIMGVFHIAGYFINRHDVAEVTTIGCVDKTKGPCRIYKGSLKTTFIKQDYIINDGKTEILIPKTQVAIMSFTK